MGFYLKMMQDVEQFKWNWCEVCFLFEWPFLHCRKIYKSINKRNDKRKKPSCQHVSLTEEFHQKAIVEILFSKICICYWITLSFAFNKKSSLRKEMCWHKSLCFLLFLLLKLSLQIHLFISEFLHTSLCAHM